MTGQVNDSFFKFPSTPHLAALSGVEIRDDKVLTASERNAFLEPGSHRRRKG